MSHSLEHHPSRHFLDTAGMLITALFAGFGRLERFCSVTTTNAARTLTVRAVELQLAMRSAA